MGTSALYDTALAPALPAGDDLASAGRAAPADEEAKRAVRRERNRQHAVASRKRKRERVEQLQTENDGLRATQAAIAAERDALQVKLANAQQEQRALQARFERMRDRPAAVALQLPNAPGQPVRRPAGHATADDAPRGLGGAATAPRLTRSRPPT